MREILFRGKQEYKKKEWVFGSLHCEYGETDKNGQRKTEYRILGMRGECDYVIPETVGQFTGLADKNGKKIFEGDILQNEEGCLFCASYRFRVEFYKGRFYGESGGDLTVCSSEMYLCEVIGNIYDNLELMEVK